MLETPFHLPPIELSVYHTDEFEDSRFKSDGSTPISDFDREAHFDLIIDIGVLRRCDSPPITYSNASEIISIRSVIYPAYTKRINTSNLLAYNKLGAYVDDKWTSIDDRDQHLTYLLQSVFRKKGFRDGQLPIIQRALMSNSVIGLLPTGGGKSITYQLSALLQPGICLVVAPIKSLMKDQVDGLKRHLIDDSLFINSSLNGRQKRAALKRMVEGEVQFVFISPERLQMPEFREVLAKMYEGQLYFSYCVIDEAHCVSEWGHDFRPAYLRLGTNAMKFCKCKNLPSLPLFGLTATASYDVLADVQRELSGNNPETRLGEESVVKAEFSKRPELQYIVKKVPLRQAFPTVREMAQEVGQSKRQMTSELINQIPFELETINSDLEDWLVKDGYGNDTVSRVSLETLSVQRFYETNDNAGLVFCPHKSWQFGVETYHGFLNEDKRLRVGSFAGGNVDIPGQEAMYANNQTKFINNELNLMVATKAFGMGIDKPNVRYTIHVNYPGSIEAYVQEAGRAGRDGKLALSYVLLTDTQQNVDAYDNDLEINMYFHKNSFKGALKEMTVIEEFFTEIRFPSKLSEIELFVHEEFHREVKCALWTPDDSPNRTRLYINENQVAIGYMLVDAFAHFTTAADGAQIMEGVVAFLKKQTEGSTLRTWIGEAKTTPGLLELFKGCNQGDEFQLVIGFENDKEHRYRLLAKWLSTVVHAEFDIHVINRIKSSSNDAFALVLAIEKEYYARTNQLLDFSERCRERDVQRGVELGSTFKLFLQLYNGIRSREDTEKVIYRLSTIGIIDDYTCDYNANVYVLTGVKRSKSEYFNQTKKYLTRYYSERTANTKLHKLAELRQLGSVSLDEFLRETCEFLVDFTYQEIKNKRELAIRDIQKACIEASEKSPLEFKEYIDLYFNSKYARTGYSFETEEGTIDASLKDRYFHEDNRLTGRESMSWIQEFVHITRIDPKAGEIDNIKHLRGACIRIKSNLSVETNTGYVVLILHAYCLFMLEYRNRNNIEEAFELLRQGFEILENNGTTETEMKRLFDTFVADLSEHNPEIISALDRHNLSFDFDSILIHRYLKQINRGIKLVKSVREKLDYHG